MRSQAEVQLAPASYRHCCFLDPCLLCAGTVLNCATCQQVLPFELRPWARRSKPCSNAKRARTEVIQILSVDYRKCFYCASMALPLRYQTAFGEKFEVSAGVTPHTMQIPSLREAAAGRRRGYVLRCTAAVMARRREEASGGANWQLAIACSLCPAKIRCFGWKQEGGQHPQTLATVSFMFKELLEGKDQVEVNKTSKLPVPDRRPASFSAKMAVHCQRR